MKVLVLGATGLLGREVMQVLKDRGIRALGAARSGADLQIDITNQMALFRLLVRVDCDAVINAAACVDVGACELDPEAAYRINGAPAAGLFPSWAGGCDGLRAVRPRVAVSPNFSNFCADASKPHRQYGLRRGPQLIFLA